MELGIQKDEFFAASGMPVCLCDADGRVIDRNGAFRNLFHFITGASDAGQPYDLASLVDPDYREGLRAALKAAGDGHAGAPYEFEIAYTGRNGLRRATQASITRLPGREFYFITFQDVTEFTAEIESLRRRNADLMTLVKLIKLITSSLEPEKIMKVALAECVRFFGMDRGWLLSLSGDSVLSNTASYGGGPMKEEVTSRIFSYFLSGSSGQFKPVILQQGRNLNIFEEETLGELGLKMLSMTPEIVHGRLIGIMCLGSSSATAELAADNLPLLQTLTHQLGIALENARLFNDLESSRRRYRLLAENMQSIVVITDLSYRILYVNKAMTEKLGYTLADLAGKTTPFLLQKGGISAEAMKQTAVLEAGGTPPPVIVELRRKDGGSEFAELTISPMIDGGKMIGFQGINRIITEQMKLETEAKRYNEEQKLLLDLLKMLTSGPDERDSAAESGAKRDMEKPDGKNMRERLARILDSASELVARTLNFDGVNIYLYEEGRGISRLAHHRRPGLPEPKSTARKVFDAEKYINQVLDGGVFKISSLDALPSDYPYREHLDGLGVQSFLSVPLIWSGKPVGILSSYSTSSREYSESDINLFKTIAAQMALTIKNAQYLDEVEQGRIDMERLSKVMISAQEEERRRIARELHDEAGQSLYALRLGLEVLRNMTGDSHAGAAALAGEQLKNVTQTIENIRRITYDLRPTLLDDLGLIPAVRWYADGFEKRSGIKVQLDMSMPADRMDPAFEVNIYRIVQEALNNAHKHAGASAINIRLRETDGVVRMEVSDNGRGFTARETGEGKGVGLLGMRERVSLMGGTLFVYSIKDLGTTISVEARAKPRS